MSVNIVVQNFNYRVFLVNVRRKEKSLKTKNLHSGKGDTRSNKVNMTFSFFI